METTLKLVVIESPYAQTARGASWNLRYLYKCIRHSLSCGEAPFASHGFYTVVLNDSIAEERKLGMEAGFAWGKVAEARVVYVDRGISPGMEKGIEEARKLNQRVTYRSLRRPNMEWFDLASVPQELINGWPFTNNPCDCDSDEAPCSER